MLYRKKWFHLLGVVGITVLLLLLVSQTLAQGLPPLRYIILVIDQSFSYSGTDRATGQDHIAMLERIVPAYKVQCPDCWLGVIVFSEEITTVVPLQPLSYWYTDTYASLVAPGSLGNGTNFVAAMAEAAEQLLEAPAPVSVERRIVLLTDLQLDTITYQRQEADLQELVSKTLLQEGIQLMVIGRSPRRSDARWWDRALIQQTGGWYLEPDGIGADDASLQTLLFAFSKSPNPITIQNDTLLSCLLVPPYQKELTVRITYSGEISAALQFSSNPSMPGSMVDSQINFEVPHPDEGEWCVTVVGTGTFQVFFMPTTGIQFRLTTTGDPQPRLPVGADLNVTYRVSPVDQPRRAIVDERMTLHAWLEDENGRLINDLRVAPDPVSQLYQAHLAGKPDLEGTYYVWAEVEAEWLPTPLQEGPLPVFWGRIPRFDGPLQAVSLTPLRIEQPFTITVSVLNVDTVDTTATPLLVRLEMAEQASGRTVYSQREECHATCTFRLPALQMAGAYTATATLYEGRTVAGVVYSPGQQERVHTVVEVGPLVFPQSWGKFLRLNWPWLLMAGVAFVLALALLWRYGYRVAVTLTQDFDTLVYRLR